MRALLLQRDALIARRIARLWRCTGLQVTVVGDPSDLSRHLGEVSLLAADEFDRDDVQEALRTHSDLRAVLWTTEPLARLLKLMLIEPRISNVLGRTSFDRAPRDWELIMVAQRFVSGGREGPPLAAYLNPGAIGFHQRVQDTAGITLAVGRIQHFLEHVGVSQWVGSTSGDLVHELLMNAVYDAPVDQHGTPRFAYDRKREVTLADHEASTLRVGCDGILLCVQVSDPFGRLGREHVLNGLARGLSGGEVDDRGGGAGLGLVVCHNATVSMVFDINPGKQTVVTGFFDLDLNRKDFRGVARSLHVF